MTKITSSALCLGLMLPLMVGCGTVFDEVQTPVSDCVCTITFEDKMNINEVDSFASEISSLTLLAFDSETHKLISITEDTVASHFKQATYQMTLNLAEGNYDLVTWCGLANNKFEFNAVPTPYITNENELCVKIAEGEVSTSKLALLHHGILKQIQVTGKCQQVMPLTQDVKYLNFKLRRTDKTPVYAKDFSLAISAQNASLDYQNQISRPQAATYRPYNQVNRMSALGYQELFSEFCISRVIADDAATLAINVKDSSQVEIPLNKCMLGIKKYYNSEMPDQEFIDRLKNWSIVVYLNASNEWDNGWVNVNGYEFKIQ